MVDLPIRKRTKKLTDRLIVISGVLLALSSAFRDSPNRVNRRRRSFAEVNASLSDSEFRTCYRLSRPTFFLLLAQLRPFLSQFNDEEQEEELQAHLSGSAIQAATKLGIFLRFMAGASYWDLMLTYGLGRSSCYSVFREVLNVCDSFLTFEGLPPKSNVQAYRRRAIDFAVSRSSFNLLPGCVGALDGTLIYLQKPSKELNNQQFYTRKGGFGVPVQALVDAKYRFIAASAICVGSTADGVAFDHSNIGRFLREEGLPCGFWFAGDEAYRCSRYIVIPIPRSMAHRFQDGFNFCLSSHRVHVEQAFGRLKNRWGILWRPLKFNLQTSLIIVNTAMRLENLCINSGDATHADAPAGAEFEPQAVAWLNVWLAWWENGYDYSFDPPIDFPGFESDGSSILSCSIGFEDNYSITRVRLCNITTKIRFKRSIPP